MAEEKLNIDGINVTLFKSRKAKSLNITIKPFTGVRVSVPEKVSFKSAKKIVELKLEWIKKHQVKINNAEDLFTVFDWSTKFKTKEHDLQLVKSESKKLQSTVRDKFIKVVIPDTLDINDGIVQEEIRKGIERAWRKEAKDYLPNRVRELAEKNGFEFKNVSIKNSRTRWGSCSLDSNINLSLHLMRLPTDLIDYVILHELTHTKVKNHSPQFWQLLDSVSGNAKKLDRKVRQYRIQIY